MQCGAGAAEGNPKGDERDGDVRALGEGQQQGAQDVRKGDWQGKHLAQVHKRLRSHISKL